MALSRSVSSEHTPHRGRFLRYRNWPGPPIISPVSGQQPRSQPTFSRMRSEHRSRRNVRPCQWRRPSLPHVAHERYPRGGFGFCRGVKSFVAAYAASPTPSYGHGSRAVPLQRRSTRKPRQHSAISATRLLSVSNTHTHTHTHTHSAHLHTYTCTLAPAQLLSPLHSPVHICHSSSPKGSSSSSSGGGGFCRHHQESSSLSAYISLNSLSTSTSLSMQYLNMASITGTLSANV